MALLPAGTANNIARSLGLDEHPETLVARWMTARATPVDLGLVSGSMGECWFVEGVGLGVFPKLMSESKRSIPKETPASEQITRNLDVMIELLERSNPFYCEVTADGRDLSGPYLILEVMNIRSIGPRIVFSPEADPTDGLLDIVAIAEADRKLAIDFLIRCRDGTPGSFELPCVRARSIQLGWESQPLHIDDDRWPDTDDARSEEHAVYSARVTTEQGAFEVLL